MGFGSRFYLTGEREARGRMYDCWSTLYSGAMPVPLLHLKSAEFGTVLGLCGQSEHLEGVRVLPFGDEFREEIGFGAIHEKFGQALS